MINSKLKTDGGKARAQVQRAGAENWNVSFLVPTPFRFGTTSNRIEDLWTERDCATYFFLGYDGRVFLRGRQKLP